MQDIDIGLFIQLGPFKDLPSLFQAVGAHVLLVLNNILLSGYSTPHGSVQNSGNY